MSLFVAIKNKDIEMIKSIANNININEMIDFSPETDEYNCTYVRDSTCPLFMAISTDIMIVKLLIGLGADVNIKSKNNMTPLHYACRQSDLNNRYEIVHLLLEYGANINEMYYGFTPIHYAIIGGCMEVVELLLKNREGKWDKNTQYNKSLLDLAKSRKIKNIIEYLEKLE